MSNPLDSRQNIKLENRVQFCCHDCNYSLFMKAEFDEAVELYFDKTNVNRIMFEHSPVIICARCDTKYKLDRGLTEVFARQMEKDTERVDV